VPRAASGTSPHAARAHLTRFGTLSAAAEAAPQRLLTSTLLAPAAGRTAPLARAMGRRKIAIELIADERSRQARLDRRALRTTCAKHRGYYSL
jgi:hypothetical protein